MNARLMLALVALSALLSANISKAVVVFSDDFEAHADVATTWVDATDRDPGAPPVGGGWTTDDGTDNFKVQVMRSPVSGGANYVFDTPYGVQFLHQWRDGAPAGRAWAGIGGAGETTIATNGTAQLSFDIHNVVGPDGWGGNYNIAAFDSAVDAFTGRAFDISFRGNGDVLTYGGGGGGGGSVSQPSLAAEYDLNEWNHVVIDLDFNTDTWSVTVDGATVSGLTFGATFDDPSNINKIQQILFEQSDASGTAGRGGLDNVLIMSPIPEPSSLCLLGLGVLALTFVRNRR